MSQRCQQKKSSQCQSCDGRVVPAAENPGTCLESIWKLILNSKLQQSQRSFGWQDKNLIYQAGQPERGRFLDHDLKIALHFRCKGRNKVSEGAEKLMSSVFVGVERRLQWSLNGSNVHQSVLKPRLAPLPAALFWWVLQEDILGLKKTEKLWTVPSVPKMWASDKMTRQRLSLGGQWA